MKENPIDLIGHSVPIMRLLVEGAISLFESEWDDNPRETADMMGYALYEVRTYIQGCQSALTELAQAEIPSVE